MKRWIIAMLIIGLGIALTYIEINSINREKAQRMEEVVVATRLIERGQVLNEDDLKTVKMIGLDKSSRYVQNFNDAVGKVAQMTLPPNTIIYEHILNDEKDVLRIGQALTTLKLLPEEALCWQVESGEYFELGIVNESSYESIGPIKIVSTFDQILGQLETPVYMLVEGSINDVMKIIKHRNLGRYELIKVGDSR